MNDNALKSQHMERKLRAESCPKRATAEAWDSRIGP